MIRDDERRAEGHGIAHGPTDEPVRLAAAHAVGAHALAWPGTRARVSLFCHQLERADEARAAGLAHQRMLGQQGQTILHELAHAGGMGKEIPLLHQLEVPERHRRAHRDARSR